MKIHRLSPWLRRHHTWAPFTLFLVNYVVEAFWFPALIIGLLLYAGDDLKAWLSSIA
ncbi:MAG: hypothetical protein ACR2RF_33115 [Geminicoccaceae bacterium]